MTEELSHDFSTDLTKKVPKSGGIHVVPLKFCMKNIPTSNDSICIHVHLQSEREKSAKDMAVTEDPDSSSPSNKQANVGEKRKSTGNLTTHYKPRKVCF